MTKTRIKANKRLHKSAFFVLAIILAICFLPIVCHAEESEDESAYADIEGIIGDFENIIPPDIGVDTDVKNITESLGVKRILAQILKVISGERLELSVFLTSLLGACLMSAIASQHEGELTLFASRSVLTVFSVMMLDKLIFLLNGMVSSLAEISSFFKAVIPVTVAVNSLGVTPTTASTQALGMGLTLGA